MTETRPAPACDDPARAVPAIELVGVGKAFHVRGETVTAVRRLDLTIGGRRGRWLRTLDRFGIGYGT